MTTPDRIAAQAASHLREFNHATITTGDDWQYAPHTYAALGNLAHLLRMLPQALEQAVLPATHSRRQGRLLIDGGGDPARAISDMRGALAEALAHAEALAAAVDRLHATTAPMGLDTRGLPESEEHEPCGESMCRCYGTGSEHADCACGCDCPRDDDGQLIED
jgi:hypothetical protein